jgi:C4-dicarboxylate transporter, DctM subunit
LDPLLIGGLALIVFLILIFNNMPIGFACALVGFGGLFFAKSFNPAIQVLGSMPFSWGTAQGLLPAPLFILMGQFVFFSGVSASLYNSAHKWMGRLPGGVALATNLAATAFGACCGSSMAGAATFGTIAYPEMKRLRYSNRLATAVIVVGGSLSSLIPPSLGFILIGFLTQTSTGKLFIAGILPGILLSLLFIATILVICTLNPKLGPRSTESITWKERFISLRGVTWMLVLFLVVIGGLYAGVFTPTEAGAIGAFGALIIGIITRGLSLRKIMEAAGATMRPTIMITTLIIGANIFNTLLAVTGITTAFSTWLKGLDMAPLAILSLILFLYIPLGMFLDIGAITILTVPIIYPPLVALGFDPVWLGVLIVLVSELGFITPPVGLNSFVVSGVTKVPLADVFIGTAPFCGVMILCLAILVAFPQISLFLPNLMK